MAQNGGGRIEPKTLLVGLGLATTPERIAELQERARQHENATRKRPERTFSSVLKAERPAPSEKETKAATLPKSGPRPALAHPKQREEFGRQEGSGEAVVLKG